MSTRRELLTSARGARASRDAAEVELLRTTIEWCAAHRVDEDQAMWLAGYGEHGLSLGGPGCPFVRESAVVEYAAALGMSTAAGSTYVAGALELRYRLPRLWARVTAGGCPVWRAMRVAARTVTLCEDGASHVDTHVAGFAHSVSLAQLERVIDDALARFDAEAAEQKRRAAAEERHAHLDLEHPSETGVVQLRAGLDLPDALDLDRALADRAGDLAALGCTAPLPVRRSLALGDLARGQSTLTGVADEHRADDGGATDSGHRPAGRAVDLYVHLSDAAVSGSAGLVGDTAEDQRGRLDDRHGVHGSMLVQAVRDWCGTAATITVRPVLDLAERIHCESYEASDRLREQTELRDRTCVFPFCTRPAVRCDHEHAIPYPEGPTATENQAPACRRHHRCKTFLRWSYVVLTPGLYLWTSPDGLRYLRSHVGTHALDAPPRTADPPPLPEQSPPPRWRKAPPLPPLPLDRRAGPPAVGDDPPVRDDPAPF